MGEKMKQLVEKAGHVNLTDLAARKLSRTKSLNTIIIFVGIMLSLATRNMAGGMMGSSVIAGLCKASEVHEC
jgi:hypothetical protein